jgi:hypothetical protein
MHKHRGLLILLVAYLCIAGAYSVSVPLGEAPDEAQHMAYIQFIAEHGRLPANLTERYRVGYKAVWPPLYHGLSSLVVAQIDTSWPPPLKRIDLSTPRRLLVYDGLTEIGAIHTEDETFPYQGRFLAWHLARLVSILLGAGVLTTTYFIALEIFPLDPTFAWGAASLVAFIPRFTFTTAVLNDDNLLNLIATLALLILVRIWKGSYRTGTFILLGTLLGLGLTTKYSAVSLGLEFVLVTVILTWRPGWASKRPSRNQTSTPAIYRIWTRLLLLAISTIIVSGWWFAYIVLRFNRIKELGWFAGLLAPLAAGGIDASSKRVISLLTNGAIPTLAEEGVPPWSLAELVLWCRTFFASFWAQFTHLDADAFYYWVLLVLCILSAVGIARAWRKLGQQDNRVVSLFRLLLLHVAAFWPLILIRHAFSRRITETAQGRYLFPAIAAISILMLFGLLQWLKSAWRTYAVIGIVAAFMSFTIVSLPLFITAAYPPYLPVRTTAEATQVDHPINATIDETIELVGYQVSDITSNGALPVTLVWRSLDHAGSDYAFDLALASRDGQVVSRWLGQPVNGRYPARAWDPDDVVRDRIELPVRGASAGDYHLTLHVASHLSQLLIPDDSTHSMPAVKTFDLSWVSLPDLSQIPPAHQWEMTLAPDLKLAGFDLWQAGDPAASTPNLALRATVPVRLVWQETVADNIDLELTLGEQLPLMAEGNLYLFFVGPEWDSGPQALKIVARQGETDIGSLEIGGAARTTIRQRSFAAPPMSTQVHANFGDEIMLLGFNFPRRRIEPGGALPITLYWQSERLTASHYIVSNHLLDNVDLRQWGGRDRVPQDYYTTVLWTPGEVVRDSYLVPVDPSAPSGVYRLDIGLYTEIQGQARHLPLVADGEVLDATGVTISPIKVGGPPQGATIKNPSPQYPRADNLEGLITLLGYDLNFEDGTVDVTLYWRCDAVSQTDYTTFVHVRASGGQAETPLAQKDRPPADGAYPTSLWDPGEVIRDYIQIPLPSDMPPGQYEIVVGLYDFSSGQRLLLLDDLGKATSDHIRLDNEIIAR